ncbi:MAG: hypothetical protein HY609_04105 [Deltaproteobacteria bacterium]|nr:hypothetical protein [Deltaproteobacteria bacterium]MBI4224092.1 hypothetical protein [Deltaproteobacteria bacterium]
MIKLSNGHSFEFMAASGALAFDGRGWLWDQPLRWAGLLRPGLFTIVTKSLTLKPRRGNLRWWNPFRCVRLLPEGAVNAVGLTNPGVDWWVKKVYPRVARSGWNFAVSIAGETLQEYVEIAIRLKGCEGLKALEINASCPNSPGELQWNTQSVIDTAKALKKQSPWPLILKLSCAHNYLTIARKLEGVVEAININSVPWPVAFPRQPSPLRKFGGGAVSGKAAQAFTWKMVRELAANTFIPVIGASVWDYEDIEKLFDLGAGAVAFGSVFLRYPWRPTLYVKRFQKNRPRAEPRRLFHDRPSRHGPSF